MIYRLRKKFIKICMFSFLAVSILIFGAIYWLSCESANRYMDTLTDIISENDGKFPKQEKFDNPPGEDGPFKGGMLGPETPFTTRFFTVMFDENGEPANANTGAVANISEEKAISYAQKALSEKRDRGWVGQFRYKVFRADTGKAVVFVNGASLRSSNITFLGITFVVFLFGNVLVLLLVIFISKRAVKPVAESYEKQKRFITDANHELKTPLTLIRTNLEIAGEELGENEWIEDMREESDRMSRLVNSLVELARMDEENTSLNMQMFDLSEAVFEMTDAFNSLAIQKGIIFKVNASPKIMYCGDETAIRRVLSILLDNAFKYCDENGTVSVELTKGRRIALIVENSFSDAGNTELNSLFDRFYRADKARTHGNGFGIGLSIAHAIIEKHHGSISAQAVDKDRIRFRVKL